MTQEEKTSQNSVLEAFLNQRAKRQNSAIVEARKLVNLYRHLSLFGDDFLNQYNEMLMGATPEVQMVLPDIIGGTVVRQYLEFLKGHAKQNDADAIISEEDAVDAYQYRHTESYLPTPDEVPPFVMTMPSYQTAGAETGIDVSVLTAQMHAFERALEQQNTFLSQALTQIQQNTVSAHSVAEGQAVDMSAFNLAQKEMLTELLMRQNEQMSANINTILSQTKEISDRQMEAVEKLMQKQSAPEHYAVIEDDVTITPQMDKTQTKTSYTPRYRSEDLPVLHQTEVELEPVIEQKEETMSHEDSIEGKRYSSITLNDYYTEQDDMSVDTLTSSDLKG